MRKPTFELRIHQGQVIREQPHRDFNYYLDKIVTLLAKTSTPSLPAEWKV